MPDTPLADDAEFVRYIEGAVQDGVLISGAQIERLRDLDPGAKRERTYPAECWYELTPCTVAPSIARIRASWRARAS